MENKLRKYIQKILQESLNTEDIPEDIPIKKDLKFTETSRGSHHGQQDLTAYATIEGIVVGYVEYSIFQNEIHIEMIEVVEEQKRQGIATKLFHFIRLKNSGMKIIPGYSTEEGSKFYNAYKSKKLKEDINVPINVGDTVLGGRFKNKKIIIKDIGKSDKGDITINDKPLLKVRIPKKINEEKLTCLYIHGLGAEISDDIKNSLSKYNLIYPKINYDKTTKPYYQCLEILNKDKVDFIIGHSIGGVMGYYLAKETNIPALLLCPAFGDEYKVLTSKLVKDNNPKIVVIIGKKDDEVDNKKVKSTLENQPNCVIKELNIGHDITEKNLILFADGFVENL